jgi:hypothetical protein
LPSLRWNELHHPEKLSVRALPEKFRLIAADQCEQSIKYHALHRQRTWLQEMATSLRATVNDTVDCEYLYDWHQDQEQKYWPDFKYRFADLWPEYQC